MEPGRTTPSVRGSAWAHATEEVRLAMGWNGGVSLAVWMGGVAVELDEARRKDPGVELTPETTTPTGAIYQALCAAFNRRLVIDILAGASAGGLNGALLAGAIAHGRPLTAEFLRPRWLDIGDFGKLLQPLEEKDPSSVMQGKIFLAQLEQTFRELLGTEGPPPVQDKAEAPVLLDIQVTNVVGEERAFIDDWNRPFYALEFRAPVRFRRSGDYVARALARAARASASFPGAFEPQEIADTAAPDGITPRTTWAIDGGLLENAPIRQAIDLIPHRGASSPVRRFVCYVNAAPTAHRERQETPQPGLTQVIGYAINLPRDGRVVDQLKALEDATRRAGLTATTGTELLGLADRELFALAGALLPTYQRRRAVLSLEELLSRGGMSGPGRAQQTLRTLASDIAADARDTVTDLARGAACLPWTPREPKDLDFPPDDPTAWRWGMRAAQRVVQLQLDILRAALLDAHSSTAADAVFAGRAPLDEALASLELARLTFLNPEGEAVQAVSRLTSRDRDERQKALAALGPPSLAAATEASIWLQLATKAFHDTLRALEQAGEQTIGPHLFRPVASEGQAEAAPAPLADEMSPAAFTGFISRALAVEVIRRSFADDLDIESAQTLHVAQLTPLIESPLFDRGHPDGPRQPADAAAPQPKPGELGPRFTKEKLTGVRLGHFAGFYRRSWRANDFMWGRLDGCAAIARLLIDTDRARALDAAGRTPWVDLAHALVPTGDTERDRDVVALLEELVPSEEGKDLEQRLASTMEDDLLRGNGERTRAVVARALQYEVLREEIDNIVKAGEEDRAAGALRTIGDWSANGSLNGVIKALRNGRGDTSLPGRLGADDRDEATSSLALRTLSQTLLVAVSALSGSVPLARALQPVRVPLLAVRGTTALRPADRFAVVAGFTGAAWYVTARLLALITGATDPDRPSPNGKVPLDAIWSAPVLAYWVCILAVVGLVAVPALRLFRTRKVFRGAIQAAAMLALFASGGAVLFGGAVKEAGMSQALTTWSAPELAPTWVLGTVAVVGGLHAASTSGWFLRVTTLLHKPVSKWVSATSVLLGAVGIVLAVYAAKNGLPHEWPGAWWPRIAVILAALAPLAALAYVRIWEVGKT